MIRTAAKLVREIILPTLGLTLLATVALAAVSVTTPVVVGKKITITGPKNATAYVYIEPKGKKGAADKCDSSATKFEINQTFSLTGAVGQDLVLTTALAIGDEVCVAIFDPAKLTTEFSTLETAVAAPAAVVDTAPAFVGSVTAGSTLKVTGSDKATLYIYTQPKAKAAAVDKCDASASAFTRNQTLTINGSGTQTITLTTPIIEGDHICLATISPASPTPQFSPLATAAAAPPPATNTPPSFAGKLIGGSDTISIVGQVPAANATNLTIAVYQLDAGYLPKANTSPTCSNTDVLEGKVLPIASTGNSTTANYATLSGTAPPYTITLDKPIVAGTRLCLVQTDSSTNPATVQTSDFGDVTDPNDYGRVRTNFTAGTVIDNQQNSTNSSSAATYLDFGVYFNWMRAGGGPQPGLTKTCKAKLGCKPYKINVPGLDSSFNVLLNQIPVSSSQSSTASAGASPTTILNVMSAQQSAQFVVASAMTWRLTRFIGNSNFFLLGPVAKAGFNTLLNPSIGSSNSTTTTATAGSSTVDKFSPLYSSMAAGTRLTWAKFSDNTDKAPVPMSQFDVTLGTFSNLPSYLCDPTRPYGATALTTAPTNTTCFTTNTPPNGKKGNDGSYYLDAYRSLIPRLHIEGFLKLPNYPFILGMDANLGQYAVGAHIRKVDPLSKPGNDVRIYFGVAIDPVKAIKNLGLANQ